MSNKDLSSRLAQTSWLCQCFKAFLGAFWNLKRLKQKRKPFSHTWFCMQAWEARQAAPIFAPPGAFCIMELLKAEEILTWHSPPRLPSLNAYELYCSRLVKCRRTSDKSILALNVVTLSSMNTNRDWQWKPRRKAVGLILEVGLSLGKVIGIRCSSV